MQTLSRIEAPIRERIVTRARELYLRHRHNRVERVLDVVQTENSFNSRPHEERDAPLHYCYRFEMGDPRPLSFYDGGRDPSTRYAAALWDVCKVVAEFEHWERLDLARIRSEYDSDRDDSWYEDDCEPIKQHFDAMENFYTVGEYRLSEDDEWEQDDSCGGHMGYDDVESPFENEIVAEHMRGINEKLRAYFDPARTFGEGI